MSALLKIWGLYGGYERDVNILQGIDITVLEGEAVGIIGLNGSGKSTLGKAIMNLLPYRKGGFLFAGQLIDNLGPHELAKKGIALMHQGGVVFPNLSVWQNLQLSARDGVQSSAVSNHLLDDIIPLLQKPKKELMRTMADRLSGGQRHELALAMTLARRPQLVVLDEPSAGLSPKAVEEMYIMLQKVRERFGLTILLIEQNIARAIEFCCSSGPCFPGRCIMLNQGKIEHIFNKDDELNITEIESLMFK